jgi:hypothetical protein
MAGWIGGVVVCTTNAAFWTDDGCVHGAGSAAHSLHFFTQCGDVFCVMWACVLGGDESSKLRPDLFQKVISPFPHAPKLINQS